MIFYDAYWNASITTSFANEQQQRQRPPDEQRRCHRGLLLRKLRRSHENRQTLEGASTDESATAHAKAMIETLHQELQPDFLKISDDLITAFAHVKRKEEALQKLKDDDDSIPSSCLIGLVLEPNGRSTKESTEFKTLDAETSAIIRDCQARLKKQVIKCVSLNLAELKHGVVKSLAKALPILAMGFSAEVDIDDEKYSEHQAVADMLYCYGEDVISALSLGATPASFIKAYKEVNKCSLPPPTKVASSSHPQSPTITIATEPLRLPPQVFNEYAPATAPTTAVL